MSFKIVQNDIVRVKADAIVNTANPYPVIGDGTDADIYEAAGSENLLRERVKIGNIARGDAKATPAFKLQAKYIIHTVGPVWIDGNSHEVETLKSCYVRSMKLAAELKCKSIAFPLIATGHYGFPRDIALSTALESFNSFLLEYPDMEITLVVYDRKSVEVSSRIFGDLQSFIDREYFNDKRNRAGKKPDGMAGVSNLRGRRYIEEQRHAEDERLTQEQGHAEEKRVAEEERQRESEAGLEPWDYIGDGSVSDSISFQKMLLEKIDEEKLSDPDFYHAAGLSRQVFSKIRSNEDYQPSKETAIASALALKLPFDDAKALLETAGYAFSRSQKFDVVIVYCIKNKIFNLMKINMMLFEQDLKIFKIS